jgi:hypothetical protein
MITIRFPSGFSVQYNGATCASNPDSDGIVRLYSSVADRSAVVNVIARCPRECILEYTSPCRTYNAAREESESQLKSQIELLRKEVRSLARKIGKAK